MNSEQICYLLLETAENENLFGQVPKSSSIEFDHSEIQDNDLTTRLYEILESLQQEKNQFVSAQQKQQQVVIQKIHIEKDQIIEDLLKSIYSLKKENEQLKFQYRKRFKVIKNMEEKYQNLILGKNKKITELQSIVKYLEGKIKYLEKKLTKFQSHFKKEISSKNAFAASKSPSNYYSPNKISVIVSKENSKLNLGNNFLPRNSLEDLTMPLRSSFISLGKATSSSKTITRNRSKQNYNQTCFRNDEPRQSDMYSSFLASTENNFNERYTDTQMNFSDHSRISPVCIQMYPKAANKYLTLEDFDDLQKKDYRHVDRSMRKSHEVTQTESRNRWYLSRDNF